MKNAKSQKIKGRNKREEVFMRRIMFKHMIIVFIVFSCLGSVSFAAETEENEVLLATPISLENSGKILVFDNHNYKVAAKDSCPDGYLCCYSTTKFEGCCPKDSPYLAKYWEATEGYCFKTLKDCMQSKKGFCYRCGECN